MKGNGRAQGKGFSCVMAVLVAAMLILAAKTAYDYWYYWNGPVTSVLADAEAYLAGVPHTSVHLKAFGMTGSTTKRLRLAVLR